MIDGNSSLEDVVFCICTALANRDLDVVLVGGSAATYYAPKAYQSQDADFVAVFVVDRVREAEVVQIMAAQGYELRANIFVHTAGSIFTVEFPKGPLGVGGDAVTKFNTIRRGEEVLHIITPTDSVRDRLARYYFWDDPGGLRAAVAVAMARPDQVDLSIVEEWSSREGELEKFGDFTRRIARAQESL